MLVALSAACAEATTTSSAAHTAKQVPAKDLLLVCRDMVIGTRTNTVYRCWRTAPCDRLDAGQNLSKHRAGPVDAA